MVIKNQFVLYYHGVVICCGYESDFLTVKIKRKKRKFERDVGVFILL